MDFNPVVEFGLPFNKHLSFGFAEVIPPWTSYFTFDIRWTRKMDHAGFHIGLAIGCFAPYFAIHDIRHWDYDGDCWVTYG